MKINCSILLTLLLISSSLTGQNGTWEVKHKIPSVNLKDICFLEDGMHGFSAGSKSDDSGEFLSIFYKTSDGGEAWESHEINLTLNAQINGIFFIDENTGWIAGDGGLMIKTIDGGNGWNFQNSTTSRDIARIQFLDENNGWATGGWSDGTQFLVLHTENGGATWQNLSFGNTAYSCLDLCFIDNETGWISGTDNMLNPHIHKTTDGGQTWTSQTVPLPAGSAGISSIDFATADIGWATVTSIYLSPAGAILHTTDGGANWTVQYNTYLHYNYLDVRDEMNLAVVGFKLLAGTSEKLFVSNDGGNTWTSSDTPIKNYTEGICHITDKIWITSNNSSILSTNTGESTWVWENVSPFLYSIGWQTADNGWCVSGSGSGGDYFTFVSEDAGSNWGIYPEAPGGGEVFWLDEQTGWMLWIGNQAKIWRTIDGGNSWNSYNIGGGSYYEQMFFVSPNVGWVFGSNGAIKKTVDGGMSWLAQNIGVSEFVASVHFINENEGWAAGGYGGGSGFIAHTSNGGDSWELQSMAQYDHILDLFFLDKYQGWACAVGGLVQSTSDGGQTWNIAGQIYDDFADEILMISPETGWMISSTSGNDGISFIYKTTDGGYSWTKDFEGDLPFSIIKDIYLSGNGTLWACGYHSLILRYSETVVTIGPDPATYAFGFFVYPNPVKETIYVDLNLKEKSAIRFVLTDMLGASKQQWKQAELEAGNHQQQLQLGSGIRPGNYILSMLSESGERMQKILVKQ